MIYRKFVYKKLIRDKILDDMISLGEIPSSRKLDDEQYRSELIKKLVEEINEINLSDSDMLGELADIQEVIDSLLKLLGKSGGDLKKLQKSKQAKFGAFDDRVFIDSVAIPSDNKWISYLEKHPDRYPEIKE